MVFVNERKYACETCIKGHRSSTCNHTDRPLFEVKKKGRPVTQCEHCRELRKTKQVHVKCECEGREEAESMSHSIPAKKANRKGPVPTAAFPNGVQSQSVSPPPEDVPANSQRAEQRTCLCKVGGTCDCCTPRHTPRRKAGGSPAEGSASDQHGLSTSKQSATPPKPIIGNIHVAPGRPASVPTRPPIRQQVQSLSTDALPSVQGQPHGLSHGHVARQTHGAMLFNPYGLAHERAHGFVHATVPSVPGAPFDEQPTMAPGIPPPQWQSQASDTLPETFDIFAVPCGCGDSCACPGCAQHRGSSAIQDIASCRNPANCMSCQSCAIDREADAYFREHASELIVPQGSQFSDIGEWLQQTSQLSVFPPANNNVQSFPTDLSGIGLLPQFMNLGIGINNSAGGSNQPASYSSLVSSQTFNNSNTRSDSRCRCPPGQCTCPQGSCECGSDYQFGTSTQIRCVSSRPVASGSTSVPIAVPNSVQSTFLSVGPNPSVRRSTSSGSRSSGTSSGSSSGSDHGGVGYTRQRPLIPRDNFSFN